MRVSIFCWALLAAVSLVGAEAGAQAGLREGVKVRISAAGAPRVTGVVQSVTPDSLIVFAEPGGTRFGIARSSIRELQVSQGRSMAAGAKRGAIWGAGAGLVGALGVMATVSEEEPDVPSPGVMAALVVAEFAGIGALIGAFVKAEQWDVVDIRPSVGYGRGGMKLGLAVR